MLQTHDAPTSRVDPAFIARIRALEAATGPGLVEEIVGGFLSSAPVQLGNLRQAGQDRNARAIEEIAHKLRGICGLLGLTAMAALLLDLESFGHAGRLDEVAVRLARVEREFIEIRSLLALEAPEAAKFLTASS